jgi:PAS domain S-box-containing protein
MRKINKLGHRVLIVVFLLVIILIGLICLTLFPFSYSTYLIIGLSIVAIALVILLVRNLLQEMDVLQESITAHKFDSSAKYPLTHTIWQWISPIFNKLQEATFFVKDIGAGVEPKPFTHLNFKDPIGTALQEMKEKLAEYREEDRKRNWSTTGLAKFSEILRLSNDDINELSQRIISNLVRYLGANQGGLYIEYENDRGDKYLELAACYAYDKKKFVEKRIYAGQGLLGECMLDHETVFLTEIPRNYVHITSGLGEATPRNIVIVPLLVNTHFYGAIEIASFGLFEKYQVEFLRELSESIASVIATVKTNVHTRKLLEESQLMGEELRVKEEELRQSMEELQSAQEEMLRHKQTELSGVFTAIDHTLGMAEFDTEGNIITANNTLLRTLNYESDEIQKLTAKLVMGKPDMLRKFWRELNNNIPQEADFKTTTKTGSLVWLSASYTPVLDTIGGRVSKILMLVQNITEKKQKDMEFQRQLETINKTLASVEFNVDGTIVDCNQIYLDLSGYTLQDVVGKTYSALLADEDIDKPQTIMMWESLKQGNVFSGEFRQKAKNGNALWLLGTFNPIQNEDGKPDKIKMFAQFITQEKEKQNDLSRITAAMKNSVPYLELTDSGIFKSANDIFLKEFGYSRNELRQKNLSFLLSESHQSTETEQLLEKLKTTEFHEEFLTFKVKDGSEKQYKASITPIRNLENQIYKTAFVLIEKASMLI